MSRSHPAAIAAEPTGNAQDEQARAFARDGFLGPVRLFTAAQCRVIADHLRNDPPPPADWRKDRAVSDRFFYELATGPALLSRLRPLLGDNIILWGASAVQRKPGQVHVWHSDMETAAPDGRFASVWIGIENTSFASSLQLIGRSHSFGKCIQQVAQEKGFRRGEASAETVLAWARELDAEAEFLQPPVSDGEALLFDGRLWHGSHNARRHGRRTALLLQYAADDTPVRIPDFTRLEWPFHYLATPRPPAILVSGRSNGEINHLVAPPPPSPKQLTVLSSAVHSLPLPLNENSEKGWRSHHVLRGCSPALELMGCHASILSAGRSPHLPHAHAEEELIIMLDGEADLIISDGPHVEGARVEKIRPGSFVYYPPFQHHTLRNSGTAPITHLMFKWRVGGSSARRRLATTIFHFGDLFPDRLKPIWGGRVLRERTAGLSRTQFARHRAAAWCGL